ncbi:type II toxin-antitoxin system RelE/ParE family toxin [Burkholderia cenocepacia]|uniref:type II toxin-antitoxin system RelE/ParE family toxin n=1 Tax=Burkholderia cenocepacia TaxID=95486 RepID=UPI001B99C417|nr:type II toxin-antitoxin system RelE/ParE family toxin [Burkholderia cenocepacia]MBR8384557.1 type II toxin-antitoxin system RelE/ParE family toxin [Burkholderia cenocepacia]
MLPVEWRPRARFKLLKILSDIAELNAFAADDLASDIEQATSNLPAHPYLYRLGRVAGTREIVVHPNYIVIYRVQPSFIEIVNVVHARQQYP